MPPERKIEKLLRAYAKKRKATGGDSFTLSSDARRRLQAEAAKRTRDKETKEGSSLSLWEFFRRQWAFVTIFSLAIVLGVALIAPLLTSNKLQSMGQVRLAMKAAAEQPVNAPAAKNLMTVGASPPPVPAAAGASVAAADLPTLAPIAATPPMDSLGLATQRDLSLAKISIAYKSPPAEYYLNDKDAAKTTTNAIAGLLVAKSTPPGEEGFGGGGAGATNGDLAAGSVEIELKKADVIREKVQPALSGNLALDNSAVQSRNMNEAGPSGSYQNVIQAGKSGVVLAHFKVTQHGDAIQIVDNDGSVYSGSWQPRVMQGEVNQALPNGSIQAKNQKAMPPGGVAAAQNQTAGIVQAAAQTYSIKVSGINLTLKQNVVFTGDISVVLAVNAAANNAQAANGNAQNFAADFNSTPVVAENRQRAANNGFNQQSLWLNSYIVGKAIVAGTNQVEVNAVSVAP